MINSKNEDDGPKISTFFRDHFNFSKQRQRFVGSKFDDAIKAKSPDLGNQIKQELGIQAVRILSQRRCSSETRRAAYNVGEVSDSPEQIGRKQCVCQGSTRPSSRPAIQHGLLGRGPD